MSRAAKRRRSIRWARYINRYHHLQGYVLVGGHAADREIWAGLQRVGHWRHVRRQAKRGAHTGRPS